MKIVLRPLTYNVGNYSNLKIDVNIKEGQLGSASFTNFDREFISGHNSASTTVALSKAYIGTKEQAIGNQRTLIVSASDSNPYHNRIPIQIKINDTLIFDEGEEAESDHDSVQFIIPITFVL